MLKKIVQAFLILCLFGYVGQTIKAMRVSELRLKWKLEEGKISEQQYANEISNINFVKTFFNPQLVISVD